MDGAEGRTGLAVNAVQRTSDGWYLFGTRLQSQPSGPADVPLRLTSLLRATPGRVEVVAEWSGDGAACVAGDTVYQLAKQLPDADPTIDLDAEAELGLIAVPLDGGPATEVELPLLGASFGGANVSLGCAAEGPYVATAAGGPGEVQAQVWQLSDGSWSQRADLVPDDPVRPEAIVSDVHGVVIGWQVGDPAGAHQAITTLDADGQARVRDGDPLGEMWRGSSSERLVLARDAEGIDGGPDIEVVEIWS